MKLLSNLGFIAAATKRSHAYVGAMDRCGVAPQITILLDAKSQKAESLAQALEGAGIPYIGVDTDDVNAPEVVAALEKSTTDIVVFSGPPGAIVRAPLFSTGRRFLHVHPGVLPEYRGSTTIYYSLLDCNQAGATALYLDAGIDTGPILATQSFEPPPNRTEIDHIFDPKIRAAVLEDFLRQMARGNLPTETPQNPDAGQTHYIIHPVLKHIAILANGS